MCAFFSYFSVFKGKPSKTNQIQMTLRPKCGDHQVQHDIMQKARKMTILTEKLKIFIKAYLTVSKNFLQGPVLF